MDSSYLQKKSSALGGVINNNNTLPILDNFTFDLSGNDLKVFCV
jgi:DNA polymerase-3 subunit beta